MPSMTFLPIVERELRVQARNMGVDYHLVRTDEPVDRVLRTYLGRRRARARPSS